MWKWENLLDWFIMLKRRGFLTRLSNCCVPQAMLFPSRKHREFLFRLIKILSATVSTHFLPTQGILVCCSGLYCLKIFLLFLFYFSVIFILPVMVFLLGASVWRWLCWWTCLLIPTNLFFLIPLSLKIPWFKG